MNTNTATQLLAQLANELPLLARQAASGDVCVRSACVMRLDELSALLAPYRQAAHRAAPSRRVVLKAGAGVFAAWAWKKDD